MRAMIEKNESDQRKSMVKVQTSINDYAKFQDKLTELQLRVTSAEENLQKSRNDKVEAKVTELESQTGVNNLPPLDRE